MSIPLGIILGLVAVLIIGYPFLRARSRRVSGDDVLGEEIERQIQELRGGRGESLESRAERFCPNCGARCGSGDKFCSGCGTNLSE